LFSLGGQYIAFYQFDAEAIQERDQLANSAKLSAHTAALSLQARLDTTITNASSYTGSKYTFVQKIFGQSHGKLPDTNNIGQFALNFGEAGLDAPVVLKFTTQSYNTVQGRPKMTNVDKLRTIFANRMAPAKGLGTIRVAAQHALDSIAIVRMTYMVAERPTIHSTLVRPRTKGTSTDNGMWDFSNMSQVIQEVSVHYSTNDWICKEITIVTNQGKYQTHAGEGDQWATWTAQPGTDCFLGFSGRFGKYVDRLMVKSVRFAPVSWE
jgi:hypothetical protein